GEWGSGGKGTNFVETMLKLAQRGAPIKVVNDQSCTPSYTADVAETTAALISTGRFGLYHVTNAGSTTWFEFAQTVFQLSGIKAHVRPIYGTEFDAPPPRATFNVLDNMVL